jgi:hypothetical protein
MKYKVYYYEDEKCCVVSKLLDSVPLFSEVRNDKNSIVIGIENKNVENIYNFFRNNTIQCILFGESKELEIDYSEILAKDFYGDDSFSKLRELIDSLILKSNEAIKLCLDEQGPILETVENVEEIEEETAEVEEE